jgi:hypothetical protein
MMKWQTIIIAALLAIGLAVACKPEYLPTENITIQNSIEPWGETADCNLTLYANTTQLQSGWMIRNGLAYNYTAGVLPIGVYHSDIICNLTALGHNNTYIGDCSFIVAREVDDKMLAIGLLLLGTIAILGYFSRNADDPNIKAILTFAVLILMVGINFIAYLTTIDLGLSVEIQKLVFVCFAIFTLIFTIMFIYTLYKFIKQVMERTAEAKI